MITLTVSGIFTHVLILKWFKGFRILAQAIILHYFTQIIMLSRSKDDCLFENFSFLRTGNRLHCSIVYSWMWRHGEMVYWNRDVVWMAGVTKVCETLWPNKRFCCALRRFRHFLKLYYKNIPSLYKFSWNFTKFFKNYLNFEMIFGKSFALDFLNPSTLTKFQFSYVSVHRCWFQKTEYEDIAITVSTVLVRVTIFEFVHKIVPSLQA